ncbi:MAG: binding-protein-dependent transport system inner rane component [Thermoleophilia bacterium]|nr:binding-protein-dependent transport system inner rane component [Thermoleophilia bacterium]
MSPVQTGAPPVEDAPSPTRSLKWRAIAAPVLRNKSAMVAVFVLGVFVFLALAGPLLIDGDPKGKVGEVFEPPSREFPLGTDGGGASMVALLVAGVQVSLLIGFCACSSASAPRRSPRSSAAPSASSRASSAAGRTPRSCASPTTSS